LIHLKIASPTIPWKRNQQEARKNMKKKGGQTKWKGAEEEAQM
jgi:hypothetical protein